MALGFNNDGEGGATQFDPLLLYRPQKGFFETHDDNQQIKDFEGAMDFANALVGQIKIQIGAAPDERLVKIGEKLPEAFPESKSGIKMPVKLNDKKYSFSSTSVLLLNSLDQLHDSYLKAKEKKEDLIPVCKVTDYEKISGKGTNFKPKWSIASWVKREEFETVASKPPPASNQESVEKF